ncbi:DUF4249 family protein [Litoribacter alkaliphilus]|uniref:DUF4249 family protein n=1 Tax=Litoribacter ruber TaxID=702568 RepID=A0AAP2G3H7_9BACT|nr:DUF4249 family protein [Litoribacter alkaliphilus]MBS9523460.1 DUF4249 family protein [Litoribacter alkaliphilus]
MDRLGKVCVFVIFLFQVSCIDEIRINVPEQERKIAVDGWVSNDPNMTYVKVY